MNGRELVAALCGQENVVVIRRPFVSWLGHVSDALLLDQAMYWQDRAGEGEWWHQSDEDMSDRICVPVRSLKRSRARLIGAGLIETVRRGIPPRIYYRVDLQAVVDGLSRSVTTHGQLAPTVPPIGPDCGADRPRLLGQLAQSSIYEGGVEGIIPPPTPANIPAYAENQLSPATVQAEGDSAGQPRRGPGRPRKAQPSPAKVPGDPRPAAPSRPSHVGRWQPVADAIAAAVRYPLAGRKPPPWLGNTIRAFGAASGDDPARALALVRAWAETRGLTDLVTDQRYFAFRRVPENAHAWLASQRGRSVSAGATAGIEDAQLARMGAPENWRALVFTHDGTRRAPSLVLPMLGLEPYAAAATWPAWYRAAEGVAS